MSSLSAQAVGCSGICQNDAAYLWNSEDQSDVGHEHQLVNETVENVDAAGSARKDGKQQGGYGENLICER